MESNQALPEMVKRSGKSMQSISLTMGRARTYLANTIAKQADPHVSIMSEIADVCGYDLQLVEREGDSVIVIDPPKRE